MTVEGSLRFVTKNADGKQTLIWMRTGTQGNKWHFVDLSFSDSEEPIQVPNRTHYTCLDIYSIYVCSHALHPIVYIWGHPGRHWRLHCHRWRAGIKQYKWVLSSWARMHLPRLSMWPEAWPYNWFCLDANQWRTGHWHSQPCSGPYFRNR